MNENWTAPTAPWNASLELSIRTLGDYVERQVKDLVNPKASVAASSLRVVFRSVTRGLPLMHNACARAGLTFSGDWAGDLARLCDVAEANKSDAGAKIRKALPLVKDLSETFKAAKAGIVGAIRLAKKKGFQY